jgi:hypothetical protein
MKTKLLALTIIFSNSALALTCENDQECLSEGISLIKKATKLDACLEQAKFVANEISYVAGPSDAMQKLEKCIVQAKKQEKVKKRAAKRMQRIEKALTAK